MSTATNVTEESGASAPDLAGDGRVAVITGAATGIGRGIAGAFARAGYRVAIADIDHEQGAEAVAELKDRGLRARFVSLDVTDETSIADAIADIVEAWGQLDVVLNNAGIVGLCTDIERLDIEDFDRVMAVNLRGPFLVCKYAVAAMRPRGGSIINISSITAQNGSPYFTAYGASKAGVETLTRGLARNLGRFSIRVNCLRPGSIGGTHLMDDFYAGKDDDRTRDLRGLRLKIPVGRLGQPGDIAHLALFLASPLSRHMNGSVLTIDGGEMLGFQ